MRDEIDDDALGGHPQRHPPDHDQALGDTGDEHIVGELLKRRRDDDREQEDRDPDESSDPVPT